MADTLYLDLSSYILRLYNHVFFATSELHSKEKAIYEQLCFLPTSFSVSYKCLF